jgi:hypothetical protein
MFHNFLTTAVQEFHVPRVPFLDHFCQYTLPIIDAGKMTRIRKLV